MAGVVGLPANLGVIADAAETSTGPARFDVRSVEVELLGKGLPARYRVAATDLRGLAVVEGDLLPAAGVEGLDAMRDADDSASRAQVPAAEFRRACADAARGGRRDGAVLAALGATDATFGVPDAGDGAERVTRLEQGRGLFPPVAAAVRLATQTPPVAVATLGAKTLATLAKVAAAFGDEVTVEFREPGRPLVLRTRNGTQVVIRPHAPRGTGRRRRRDRGHSF
jgi:hypothetical protein